MKTNKFWLLAALTATFVLIGCDKQEPFDTQTENDAPLILKPYNESGTGSFTYNLASPETPLLDSVTVTPSAYTTVNWYLDNQLVHTGNRIEMCFPAGSYELLIEAVTTIGKRTTRSGSVTVQPNDTDPYSGAPAAGRHCVPGSPYMVVGSNLSSVASIIVSRDIFFKDIVCTIEDLAGDDLSITFTLPEMADGRYFLRFKDGEGEVYGADAINVHNTAVILDGYQEFVPGEEWNILGVKLENVTSVKVDDIVITDLTVTSTTISFIAPEAEVGEHLLSITNADGSPAYFITDEGMVTEVIAIVSPELTIWDEGPVALDWNADLVNINLATMKSVPVGSTIIIYYDVPEAEYHNMRVTTPWWGDDLVAQFDVIVGETPNPYIFTYDERCKQIVETVGSWSIVGFGETINKVTVK